MAFHEIRFPLGIAFGSSGGPERRTEIVALGSGHEERNTSWANSRRRYNAGYGVRSLADLQEVTAFFEARLGRLHGFRWHDAVDFSSAAPDAQLTPTDQALGLGDGVQADFQLVKIYASGPTSYQRTITKLVAGSVRVSVNAVEQTQAVDFVADITTGLLTFLSGREPSLGAAVTAGFEFDVPVRFDSDFLEINLTAFDAGDIPAIPLIEIRI